MAMRFSLSKVHTLRWFKLLSRFKWKKLNVKEVWYTRGLDSSYFTSWAFALVIGGMDATLLDCGLQGCAISLTEGFCYFCPVKSKANVYTKNLWWLMVLWVLYSKQKDFWINILKVCEELDVQLFATTHSEECTQAFVSASRFLKNTNQIRLIKLEESTNKDKVYASTFTYNQIVAGLDSNVELRG